MPKQTVPDIDFEKFVASFLYLVADGVQSPDKKVSQMPKRAKEPSWKKLNFAGKHLR